MPVTLLYGPERALVARLVLSLLRTVRKVYTPELTLEEASEFLFLMMHLFIGHVQGRPLSASRLYYGNAPYDCVATARGTDRVRLPRAYRQWLLSHRKIKCPEPTPRIVRPHQQHPTRSQRTVQNGHPAIDNKSCG